QRPPNRAFRDSTKNLELQAGRGALAFVLRARSGLRPLTGPIPGYFVRSIPAARGILAGQAELAPGARRQRRCPASTIVRMNDPATCSRATTTPVLRTPPSPPRSV